MNKPIAIAVVSVLVLVAAFFGYRSYKDGVERQKIAQRIVDERMAADLRQKESDRQAAVVAESRRMAEEKAKQDRAEAEKRLAQLRAEQAVAEEARKAAEAESARLAVESERLRKEAETAQGEAKLLAEQRRREAAAADQSRRDALAKLQQLEQEKRELADREEARLAALRRQQELELAAVDQRDPMNKSVYPGDYKRREHYYQQVEMYNSNISKPTDAAPASTPAATVIEEKK